MSHREFAPIERNVPPGFTSWAIAAPPLCENRCQYGPDNLCWRQSVLSTLLEQRLARVPSSLNHSLRDGLLSDKMGDYSTHVRVPAHLYPMPPGLSQQRQELLQAMKKLGPIKPMGLARS
jgi:hypothetical protein